MELGKPSFVSIAAWVALAAIVIYLIFVATHKTDSDSYTKGASHNEATTTTAPIHNYYPLSMGCDRFIVTETPSGIKYQDPDKPKVKK